MMTSDHDQQQSPESYTSADNRLALPLVVTVIALVVFLLGFFSLYFCRCIYNAAWLQFQPPNTAARRSRSGQRRGAGLHPTVVASFPTFPYGLVKDHHCGKCGLECAICLSEFASEDVLRLLTACSHTFHLGCIDLWFESHTTCPVCRRELDPATVSPDKATEVRIQMSESEDREERVELEERLETEQQRNSFKEEEERRGGDMAAERRVHMAVIDWLPRSTGHSLADDDERFALRLPENVKERIMRERNWSGSCIAFGHYLDGKKEESSDHLSTTMP